MRLTKRLCAALCAFALGVIISPLLPIVLAAALWGEMEEEGE